MKILNFYLDKELIIQNQIELSDTIRYLLYQEDNTIFDRLNYEDDSIYLEPALFFHFLENKKEFLAQTLFGYYGIPPKNLQLRADKFGCAHLPNSGYVQFDQEGIYELKNTHIINAQNIIDGTNIRLCPNIPLILTHFLDGSFQESVLETNQKYAPLVENALKIIQIIDIDFWDLLNGITREISLYNSADLYSMAAISYHGTAFINIGLQEQHKEIFFIEDIAHQCGHLIFNILTLKTDQYLKLDKETLLSDLLGEERESRTLYGSFHGLFTYTTILHCFSKCLENNIFIGRQKQEIFARMGFYMEKFAWDLDTLHNPVYLTEQGMNFWQQFKDSYESIKNLYLSEYKAFNYANQNYIFHFDKFLQVNK